MCCRGRTGGRVSNSYYAQDGKIRRASINPISDFQDQADPSKELIERPMVISYLLLRAPCVRVSRSWSPCETNLPTDVIVNIELLELGLDKPRWPDRDQKPYNMFGDNGGEKHILQVDHQSHDYSVISPNTFF